MAYSVAIIGTGNLASHLAPAFNTLDFLSIDYIVSKKYKNAIAFAEKLEAKALESPVDIPDSVNIIFVWTNDDLIGNISLKLKGNLNSSTCIIHSSGSKPMDLLPEYFCNRAVMWPIQSFSKHDPSLNLSNTPFCILASNETSQVLVHNISSSISNKVVEVSEIQKSKLHLSAVFTNNFTNHLYLIAQNILTDTNLSLDILLPMIVKSVEKIKSIDPSKTQTGPAFRKDYDTMQKHMDLLHHDKDLGNLYKTISDHIIKLKGE